MEKRFQDKVIVITGGASGIGKQAALDFAALGARVLIATRKNITAAEAVVKRIMQQGGTAAFVRCDVTNETDVANMVEAAVKRYGRIDIAFNNAGIGADGVTMERVPIADLTEQDWDLVSNTNLKGLFFCMKHELLQMRRQGSGCIVTTASSAGIKPIANFGAYGPSKAGAIMLTKMVALENRGTGIRANVICPGPTLGTGLADRTFGAYDPAQPRPKAEGTNVDMGYVTDISAALQWLCSEECHHINGNVITVDGGLDIL